MAELSQISTHANLYGAVSQGHIMEDRLTLKGKEGNRKKRWISLLGSPQFSLYLSCMTLYPLSKKGSTTSVSKILYVCLKKMRAVLWIMLFSSSKALSFWDI
ncbi:hypothetical protein SAY87_024519 [Trapa incisa]|uniref:Uncharacterized protein n=1 Tax=Trapa incisa TaxID=236973 RepID=A0AAN7J8R0_9MYRT|nr:hypothetical protein SAY87_024519 [Trapa incisa]